MAHILENKQYIKDVRTIAELELPWEELKGKTFAVSGASGMIGSFLIDVLLRGRPELKVHVLAVVRNESRAKERFAPYLEKGNLEILAADINNEVPNIAVENVDYVIHAASNTHPRAYATEPIQTLLTNVLGTEHMLRFGLEHHMKRFLFISSVEIYGENRGDVEKFDESYCGYLDCNTLRAGYPEGKRAGEALCQAYIKEKWADIVIPRLPRVFGPGLLKSDTKALSQFLHKAVSGEDIVLKSEGKQQYSYIYAADAVSGILYALLRGKTGEAYNVADSALDISLAELAKTVADYAGKKVVFEIPDAVEQAGYSKATKAMLNSGKLIELGWKAKFDLSGSIANTIDILKTI